MCKETLHCKKICTPDNKKGASENPQPLLNFYVTDRETYCPFFRSTKISLATALRVSKTPSPVAAQAS